MPIMIRRIVIIIIILQFSLAGVQSAKAQCSICTRTAQQLGEKPAKALNAGIVYLAFMPMAICTSVIAGGEAIAKSDPDFLRKLPNISDEYIRS
jgi:hypothetical protein